MRNTILIIVLLIIVGFVGMFYFNQQTENGIDPQGGAGIQVPGNSEMPGTSETTTLVLYFQDKEVAATSDCGVTRQVTRVIPKTVGVADASLKILFDEELSQYGVYDSINISNGVAEVRLTSGMTPAGKPISSLSSCESRHLLSVLNDTLTQYPEITSVKISSPSGTIEF